MFVQASFLSCSSEHQEHIITPQQSYKFQVYKNKTVVRGCVGYAVEMMRKKGNNNFKIVYFDNDMIIKTL